MNRSKTNKKQGKRTGNTATVTRISNIHKPDGYSLEQWQRALRAQQAIKETMSVQESDSENAPGQYVVNNPYTKNHYQVRYYGPGHPLNGCSCMDYKTSRIGTCKHIEAVRLWISSSRKHKICKPDLRKTCLYVDYSQEPTIRCLYGTEDRKKLEVILSPLFKKDGTLSVTGQWKLWEAIRYARNLSEWFICADDALLMAARLFDDHRRLKVLDAVFRKTEWWKGLFCQGIHPYPYQEEGMKFAARSGRCIIADEMGLGKTIQAIGTAALYIREGFVNSVLVICPTSLKYQWKREIANFTGAQAVVVEGNHLERKKLYESDGCFKIVSYNAVNNDIRIMGGLHTDFLIMDEVQRLKNWDTQIARSARKISSDYAVILSGTPLENKLEELYSIVQLVDQFHLGPYYAFRNNHIEVSNSGKVIGYKGLNTIGRQLAPILLRRRKSDVALQLPARMDKNLFVPMTKEQRGIHSEYADVVARIVHKWQHTHFLSETDRRRLLISLSMMRMVCDSTYILDQNTRCDTKVEETMNILDSIFSSGSEKVVIFSGWERMTRLIAMELDARGISYSNLNGSVPSAKRRDLIDRFTDDPEVKVFLSTDAGATGLNLQVASYVINLDLPWNPAVLEQRIGRIYRIGQKNNIQVINLVAIDSIEERMLLKLKFKTGLFDGVLNGGEDEVYLSDSKLGEIVKDLGFVKEPEYETAMPDADVFGASVTEEPETPRSGADESQPVSDESLDRIEQQMTDDEISDESSADNAENLIPPSDLIAQGVSFLGGLVQTLKDPDRSRQLVDNLVKEDPSTGKTSINIPVSSKETVVQLFDLIAKLLK